MEVSLTAAAEAVFTLYCARTQPTSCSYAHNHTVQTGPGKMDDQSQVHIHPTRSMRQLLILLQETIPKGYENTLRTL